MRYVLTREHAPSAGDLRALGAGDEIRVRRSATFRDDWGILGSAVAAAYARGAHVAFVDDTEGTP